MIVARAGSGGLGKVPAPSYSVHLGDSIASANCMEQQATKTTDRLTLVSSTEHPNAAVGPIRACVRQALDTYFRQLNGHECDGLHKLVLTEVEVPLLEAVLAYCGGNQTKAAQLLGINRGTLRKKLQQYGLGE